MSRSPSPRPGRPVRGSSTGRPIMALFDLVGRPWTMRVLWELDRAEGPLTFRALRAECGDVSSSVLTQRLHELVDARLVEHTGDGYELTAVGRDLGTSLQPLIEWSYAWQDEVGTGPQIQ